MIPHTHTQIEGTEIISVQPLSLVSAEVFGLISPTRAENPVFDYLYKNRNTSGLKQGKIVLAERFDAPPIVLIGLASDAHTDLFLQGITAAGIRDIQTKSKGGAFFEVDWKKAQVVITDKSDTIGPIQDRFLPYAKAQLESAVSQYVSEKYGGRQYHEDGILVRSRSGLLNARLSENPKAVTDNAVIICPGLAVGMEGNFVCEMQDRVMRRVDIKHALRFNFFGHNENDLNSSVEGFTFSTALEDVKACIGYLKAEGAGKITVVCSSTGAQPAVLAGCLDNHLERPDKIIARAAVLDCFTSLLAGLPASLVETWKAAGVFDFQVGGRSVRFGSEFISDIEAWKEKLDLSRLKSELVLIHGSEDQVVPLKVIKKAVEKIPEELLTLIAINGEGHDFSGDLENNHFNLMLQHL